MAKKKKFSNGVKKTFEGFLFNRIEKIGNKEYNHVGCEGDNESFGDFLAQFVPKVGMRRKVKFTIEAIEEPKMVEKYRLYKE